MPLWLPLISAGLVISLAFGLGMVLLFVNSEIGANASLGIALGATLAIMISAALLAARGDGEIH